MKTGLVMGRLTLGEIILLWVYVFSFAFDFKGKPGGSLFQYLFLVVSVVSGLGLYFYGKLAKQTIKDQLGVKNVTVVWLFYLCGTGVVAMAWEIPFGQYGRVVLPFLLCGLSLLIVYNFQSRFINPTQLLTPLLYAALTSTVWTAFYATSVAEIPWETMRYQILSPALPFLLGFSFVVIFIRHQFDFLSVFAFTISIALIVLSMTRSFLITLIFLIMGFVFVVSVLPIRKIINLLIGVALIVLVVSLPAWVVANQFRTDIVEKWTERLVTQSADLGFDLTLHTRLAEYSGQWNLLTNNVQSMVLGRGLGSKFSWSEEYVKKKPVLARFFLIGGTDVWAVNHSMWMYSVYSGGLLLGWIVPIVFLGGLLKGVVVARRQYLVSVPPIRGIATIPFFVILAYLGTSFTFTPFHSRLSGLILGFMFGMANWFYDQYKIDSNRQAAAGEADSAMVVRRA